MIWQISKEFDFCYGHRVWSQELNPDFSLDPCLSCRHLHGHQGKVIVHLESRELQRGMVTDFAHLNWFKRFIDEVLDHRFIIDIDDPLFPTLLPHFADKSALVWMEEGYARVDFERIKGESSPILELYESFVVVRFVPTSESIASWLLELLRSRIQPLGVKVSSVEFLETPKSRARVYNEA